MHISYSPSPSKDGSLQNDAYFDERNKHNNLPKMLFGGLMFGITLHLHLPLDLFLGMLGRLLCLFVFIKTTCHF
jgi:hypothetical protein